MSTVSDYNVYDMFRKSSCLSDPFKDRTLLALYCNNLCGLPQPYTFKFEFISVDKLCFHLKVDCFIR